MNVHRVIMTGAFIPGATIKAVGIPTLMVDRKVTVYTSGKPEHKRQRGAFAVASITRD